MGIFIGHQTAVHECSHVIVPLTNADKAYLCGGVSPTVTSVRKQRMLRVWHLE